MKGQAGWCAIKAPRPVVELNRSRKSNGSAHGGRWEGNEIGFFFSIPLPIKKVFILFPNSFRSIF